jgi:hypothetical protein
MTKAVARKVIELFICDSWFGFALRLSVPR